ncbi:hypothetical protein BASA60_001213 [Batrachochytrium salamandrivorans]|nr:hypothetical protein BASA60_001213 [Batrachochytrium salamandrivorans]
MTRRSSSLSSTIAAITFAVLVVARSAQGAPAPEESNSSAGKSGPVLDLGALGLGSPIMIPEGYRLPQSSPAQSAPGSAATSAPSQPPPAPSQPPPAPSQPTCSIPPRLLHLRHHLRHHQILCHHPLHPNHHHQVLYLRHHQISMPSTRSPSQPSTTTSPPPSPDSMPAPSQPSPQSPDSMPVPVSPQKEEDARSWRSDRSSPVPCNRSINARTWFPPHLHNQRQAPPPVVKSLASVAASGTAPEPPPAPVETTALPVPAPYPSVPVKTPCEKTLPTQAPDHHQHLWRLLPCLFQLLLHQSLSSPSVPVKTPCETTLPTQAPEPPPAPVETTALPIPAPAPSVPVKTPCETTLPTQAPPPPPVETALPAPAPAPYPSTAPIRRKKHLKCRHIKYRKGHKITSWPTSPPVETALPIPALWRLLPCQLQLLLHQSL